MNKSLHRLLCLPLLAAVAMVLCWHYGQPLDRAAFSLVARGSANPPFFISGNGTPEEPWSLRILSTKSTPDPSLTPITVSLGDDVEGYFQGSPHSAVDLAVVLRNMSRLGAQHAACSVLLAWETPDPISLLALENELARFDSILTAAPLTRGATPSAIPPSFRKASLPISKVKGNTSAIPVINRIAIPGVILGGENATSGFTLLEPEKNSRFMPILARWDDRIVFSFSFLAALQRMNVPLEEIEVRCGQYIKLGSTGKIMLLDSHGRFPVRLGKMTAPHEISAEALIDTTPETLGPDFSSTLPWLLRDDRSITQAEFPDFSENLIPRISSIASEAGLGKPRIYPRPEKRTELLLLGSIGLIILGLASYHPFSRNIGFLLLTGACILSQALLAGQFSIWLPGTTGLAGISAAWLISFMLGAPKTAPAPAISTHPAPIPEPIAEPPPTEPTPKPAKKAATKTTAKKAAKKTPAKKAAKKTAKKSTTRKRKS